MFVWGGTDANNNTYLNTGAAYSPATNSWTVMPVTAFTPAGRIGHSAVWTGTDMIVWGGKHFTGGSFQYFNDGGSFRTGWNGITTNGAPSVREGHSAVWTGNEMIIWGGTSLLHRGDGGRYNPTTFTWVEFLIYGAPFERAFHKAFWTGKEMIVWGGSTFSGSTVQLNDGGRYDGTWAPIPASGGPPAHSGFTAVWTGTEMLLWGGSNFGTDIWAFKPNTSMFLYQRP
jgi:hypothetical protein